MIDFSFISLQTLGLILFVALLILYTIGFLAIAYHLLRFGIGIFPKLLFIIFTVGSILLIITSVNFYRIFDASALFEQLDLNLSAWLDLAL